MQPALFAAGCDVREGNRPEVDFQRMLSMESEDMLDLAEKHISEHSLQDFYEDVFVPALLLSEEDRHNGALPETRQRFIFQASRELIDELERQDEVARLEALGANDTHTEPATMPALPLVLGLPARDELRALRLAPRFDLLPR